MVLTPFNAALVVCVVGLGRGMGEAMPIADFVTSGESYEVLYPIYITKDLSQVSVVQIGHFENCFLYFIPLEVGKPRSIRHKEYSALLLRKRVSDKIISLAA